MGKTQYGLVVGAFVNDYLTGNIKKHELTRRDKEEDRMKHVRVNNANIEPVFFAYPAKDEINKIVAKYTKEKPVYSSSLLSMASVTSSGSSMMLPTSSASRNSR